MDAESAFKFLAFPNFTTNNNSLYGRRKGKKYVFQFYLEKPSQCVFKVTEFQNKPVIHICKGKHFLPLNINEYEQFCQIISELDKKIELCQKKDRTKGRKF